MPNKKKNNYSEFQIKSSDLAHRYQKAVSILIRNNSFIEK